jgi:alpha-methylacyl-CoA racemase
MGPLEGFKIVEFGGIGPGPMCAMFLADLGAEIVRIDRKQPSNLGLPKIPRFDLVLRGRPILKLDLKAPAAVKMTLSLIEKSDALIEGFRPGVMERLGMGPDICHERQPRLVYGRMTGWGQTGPLAQTAGHDLNYIGLAGVLHAMGRKGERPSIPLNLIGDYAGAIYLAAGIIAATWHAGRTGRGQIVDAAMIETSAHLMTPFVGLTAAGQWNAERGSNILDSGAFFYDVFECGDGKYVSVASIEAKFFEGLLAKLGLTPQEVPPQGDQQRWNEGRRVLADKFLSRGRDEWTALFDGSDACVTPVLSLDEAPAHPQFVARKSFLSIDGIIQPAAAPRFSATPPMPPKPPDTGISIPETTLAPWFSPDEIGAFRRDGAFD